MLKGFFHEQQAFHGLLLVVITHTDQVKYPTRNLLSAVHTDGHSKASDLPCISWQSLKSSMEVLEGPTIEIALHQTQAAVEMINVVP